MRSGKVELITNEYKIKITEKGVYYIQNEALFRLDSDGERILITNDYTYDFVYHDGYLYYACEDGIFQTLPDGSAKVMLKECVSYVMAVCEPYIFYTEYIPYSAEDYHDDGPPAPLGQLHRMSLSGENDENLTVLVTDLNSYNGFVYFSDDANSALYRMNPASLEKMSIYDDYFIDTPIFDNGFVYFINGRQLKKMSLEQRNVTALTDGGWANDCICVLEDYIYFNMYGSVGEGEASGLCKIKTDGTGFEILHG